MKIIAELLRLYMDKRKITNIGLAREMCVNITEVEKMLNGESIDIDTAELFIRYFTAKEAQYLIDWEAMGKENPLIN